MARILMTVAMLAGAAPCAAHDVYLMNSNHTDYNWNGTAAQYDAAMLSELDYYLQQIVATAGAPFEEQARYTPDNWYWMYLYENNRTPVQFEQLVDAMRSGHITVPLNPFVTLYGALPTEAVIRAGYYPGRIARRYALELPLAENIENHTSPWGLASVWAGSGVRYTWKGGCGCVQSAPHRSDDELFFWEGPDGKTLLFKWYELLGSNRDWGGYSEARDNLASPGQIDDEIARTQSRQPGISVTGLFGAGWDDVGWETTAVVDAVEAYNAGFGPDRAIVSNGIDFFEALEASGETSLLGTLRGGWGNDWDMWPASLAERTARSRRAMERLRTAELLAAWAERENTGFWPPVRDSLEQGLVSAWKYFEHGWNVAGGGPTLSQMQADKETWTREIEDAVDQAIADAETVLAARFDTPDEDRVVVFNPLGFERTDVAEIPAPGPGPFVVVDVATGAEVPTQVDMRDAAVFLRFLASDVPSTGYRVYRYEAGTPSILPDAATISTASRTIENADYRVVLGTRGEIIQATHLAPVPDVELAGIDGLSDYGSGTVIATTAESVGPVSATLRLDLTSPSRTVRVTLYAGIDRIDVDNTVLQNQTGFHSYGFHTALAGAEIRFEEVGAVARPGLVADGGDFLPGTRASRMTLNHFVDFALGDYHLVLSNRDAYAMQVNDSTNATFDLTGDEIRVVVTEQASGAGTSNQGGDDFFLNRFALRGIDAPWNGTEAMRTALAHQNPLHVVGLPRNQSGPLTDPVAGLVSIDDGDIVVTAFKPAEDPGAGFVIRVWELGGEPRSFGVDASGLQAVQAWHTSLVETDIAPAGIGSGTIRASIDANEIKTYRFIGPSELLDLQIERAGADVVLSWASGSPPYAVRRRDGADPNGPWTEITPPGGITDSFWTDVDAAVDGADYLYRVFRLP
jgi:alpha-mannosidase